MAAKPNVPPIDEEVTFKELGMENKSLITKTDIRGVIAFVNRNYTILTGYSKEDLLGKPHSIVRHPDMPEVAFKQMWDIIKSGEVWDGLVKNLRKDGRYYWTFVRIEPFRDGYGNIIGYIGLRRVPDERSVIRAKTKYKELREKEIF